MNKLQQPGSNRIPCVTVTVAIMGLLIPAALWAANPEPVAVGVTFVNPIAITEVSALQFGSIDQNLANLESVTVAPGGAVTDPANRVQGGTQAAASMTVTATAGQAITVHVDSVVPGAGYSLTDFRCNYNSGTDSACDGAGYSATSVPSGTLFVGATLKGDGTSVAGVADGSFEVTVSYQ